MWGEGGYLPPPGGFVLADSVRDARFAPETPRAARSRFPLLGRGLGFEACGPEAGLGCPPRRRSHPSAIAGDL